MAVVAQVSLDATDAVMASFPLTQAATVFGRDADCDVVLDDVHCSRRHLEIHTAGDAYVLRDLESTNGVLLNGQRVLAECQLREGDVVELGRTRLVFHAGRVTQDSFLNSVLPVAELDDRLPDLAPRQMARKTRQPVRSWNSMVIAITLAPVAVIAGLCMQPAGQQALVSPGGDKKDAASHARRGGGDRLQTDDATHDASGGHHAAVPPRLPTRSADSRPARMPSTGRPAMSAGPATLKNLLEQVPVEPPVAPREEAPVVESLTSADQPAVPQPDAVAAGASVASRTSAPDRPTGPLQEDKPLAVAEATASQAESGRLAVPPADQVDRELRAINKAFGGHFSGREDVTRVLTKIRSSDRQTDHPVKTFALLIMGERESIKAELYRDAIDCLRLRAEMFDVDELPARIELLRGASGGEVGPSAAVFDLVVDAAVEAMRAERFDIAIKAAHLAGNLADTLDQVARKHVLIEQPAGVKTWGPLAGNAVREAAPPSGTNDLNQAARRVTIATNLRKRIQDSKRLRSKYVEAAEKLRESPSDKSAAETVGKYLCFVKQDWRSGIPALAVGRDAALGRLAARELELAAEEAADPMAAFEVANAWWMFAERGIRASSLPAGSNEVIRSHAAEIYERILGRLNDPIEATLAESRIAAAKAGFESHGPEAEIKAP